MFMTNQFIIIFIMCSVFLTVLSAVKLSKEKHTKALTIGLFCAILAGVALVLFDMSLACVAAVFSH
ncbi:MAG: hypothetical protein IJ679_06405 [Lachnospiraceae bacterium]|nr:hypothetical protein [Lachnospiraceae bacterium]